VRFDALAKRIGIQIVDHRRRSGITQSELARRSNLSLKYISMIESGANSSLRTLLRICDGLDVPLHELVDEARRGPPPSRRRRTRVSPMALPIPHDCPHFRRLVSILRGLHGEGKERVLGILRSL